MTQSKFIYVTYIRTMPEKLWAALIEPDFTRQYWGNTHQVSEWKPGADWKIMIPDGRVGDSGKVVEFNPHKRIVLTWQNEFVPEMKAEGHSTLTYDLEPMGESVKLTLTHQIPVANSKLIGAVSEGWPHILASLKTLLETGSSLVETRDWPKGH